MAYLIGLKNRPPIPKSEGEKQSESADYNRQSVDPWSPSGTFKLPISERKSGHKSLSTSKSYKEYVVGLDNFYFLCLPGTSMLENPEECPIPKTSSKGTK